MSRPQFGFCGTSKLFSSGGWFFRSKLVDGPHCATVYSIKAVAELLTVDTYHTTATRAISAAFFMLNQPGIVWTDYMLWAGCIPPWMRIFMSSGGGGLD